jgi:4'-phosphopantetheinyl transferase
MHEPDGRTWRARCGWPTPEDGPTLHANEVHVWCARLDITAAEREQVEPWLSGDERTRAERFCFERDRTRYVVRRAMLRALVGRYAGVHPSRVAFSYTQRGKPRLAVPLDIHDLSFNSSHSQDLALFAFARHSAVGVDVEWMRPLEDATTIAQRFFTTREIAALNSVDLSARTEAFYNCWTRKEAFVKATGEGLQRPLDSFDVSLIPGEPARLLSCADGDVAAWSLHSVNPAAGFVGAVAAPDGHLTLHCWQLQL